MNALAVWYAALIGLWLVLRRLTRDRPWWLQASNDFTPVLLIPSAPLLLLSLARRSRIGLLAALVPGSALMALYGERFTPKPRPQCNRPALRLMTLNLLCRRRSVDATLRAIRDTNADIVMLQEVLPSMGGLLGTELQDEYPFQAIYPAGNARGSAVLSRLPFEREERLQLASGGWYCQEVRTNWEGHRLALFNVHLLRPKLRFTPKPGRPPFDSGVRAVEIRRLIGLLPMDDHDIVIAGDCNMTDQSEDYRTLRRYLNDAFLDAGSGFGFTYPAKSPHGKSWYERHAPAFLRLDHVFYRGRLRARSATVGPNGDSDHFSLVVELEALPDERKRLTA